MQKPHKPMQILVYQDVLCAWCFLADARLSRLREELAGLVSWKTRPYALRLKDALPSASAVSEWTSELRLAAKEPEGRLISTELWTGADPPRSSVPALAAVEAARLQSPECAERLTRALWRAGLEQGINISRPDVVLEVAARLGLDMNRFTAAFQSPHTANLIREEHRLAAARGVKGAPTLVIGGRWMISGLREPDEYRDHLWACLRKHAAAAAMRQSDRGLH